LRPPHFPTRVAASPMKSAASTASRDDARLWAIALGLSLLVNAGILLVAGFISLKSQVFQKTRPVPPTAATETTVTIFPEMIEATAKVAEITTAPTSSPTTSGKPSFARTAEEQLAPKNPRSSASGTPRRRATGVRTPPLRRCLRKPESHPETARISKRRRAVTKTAASPAIKFQSHSPPRRRLPKQAPHPPIPPLRRQHPLPKKPRCPARTIPNPVPHPAKP
jgi:hypothetical protein